MWVDLPKVRKTVRSTDAWLMATKLAIETEQAKVTALADRKMGATLELQMEILKELRWWDMMKVHPLKGRMLANMKGVSKVLQQKGIASDIQRVHLK